MIVDFQYYSDVYKGTEADSASFPTLSAQAHRIINAMARWQVTEENFSSFPGIVQTLYKLAVCSEIDFLAIEGIDTINSGDSGGFTVGKVTIHGKTGSAKAGAMSANISAAALTYLEQSGLMNPAVPVVGCCPC